MLRVLIRVGEAARPNHSLAKRVQVGQRHLLFQRRQRAVLRRPERLQLVEVIRYRLRRRSLRTNNYMETKENRSIGCQMSGKIEKLLQQRVGGTRASTCASV